MSIKIDCNELIIKNKGLLQTYKNGYSKSVLDDLSVNGWKIYLLAPDYKDDFSDDFKRYENNEQIIIYKSFVQSELYFQLVKTIIVLQKELFTVFEKSVLVEQLNNLIKIFFDVLKSETDCYWQQNVDGLIQAQFEKYYSDGITYPKPNDFTKEYVTSIVSSLLKENKDKEESKDYTKENWFKAGLKFVDGTVYDFIVIKSTGYSGGGFAELVFNEQKVKMSESEFATLIKHTRGYIGNTIDFLQHKKNKDRNLFKENYEYKWRIICDYHKEQGGKIDKRFEECFVKTYGVQIE